MESVSVVIAMHFNGHENFMYFKMIHCIVTEYILIQIWIGLFLVNVLLIPLLGIVSSLTDGIHGTSNSIVPLSMMDMIQVLLCQSKDN